MYTALLKENTGVVNSGKPKRKKPRVKISEEVKVYEELGEQVLEYEEQLAAFEAEQQEAAENQLAARKEEAQQLIKYQEQVEQLERKLKRKTNEVKNLSENLNTIKLESENHEGTILTLRLETEELKMNLSKSQQENLQLYDQLAIKAKEIMENVRVSELESELDQHKRALGKTQEENWLLNEKLRLESEQIKSLEIALMEEMKNKSSGSAVDFDDQEVRDILDEKERQIKSKAEELDQAEEMLKGADEMMKERDRENAWLNDMLSQHVEKIQEKECEFQSLQHCMTEENETVHQIEKEMVRLIKIIEEDQQNAAIKDHMISGYSEEIKYLKEKLDAEKQTLAKQKETADQNLEIALNNKNSEIETLQKELEELRASVQDKQTHLEQSTNNLQQSQNKIAGLESELGKLQEATKHHQSHLDALKSENQRLKSLEDNGVDYATLHQKLIREGALNKELEDEIIQLRMEKSNAQAQGGYGRAPGSPRTQLVVQQPDGAMQEYFKSLSFEIKRLQNELLNEKQISNHIQITQEKELLLKDREIQRLCAMLNPLGVVSKMTKADLSALVPRRGHEDTTDTEEESTLSLSYHDAMSDEQKRILEADEISLG